MQYLGIISGSYRVFTFFASFRSVTFSFLFFAGLERAVPTSQASTSIVIEQ